MSRNKINLEEIIKSETSINTTSIEMYENGVFDKVDVLKSMKEACRQALELAAEKAMIENDSNKRQKHFTTEGGQHFVISKQSILDVINLIEL